MTGTFESSEAGSAITRRRPPSSSSPSSPRCATRRTTSTGSSSDLVAQDFDGELEVLVADGGSTDGSALRLVVAARAAGLSLPRPRQPGALRLDRPEPLHRGRAR